MAEAGHINKKAVIFEAMITEGSLSLNMVYVEKMEVKEMEERWRGEQKIFNKTPTIL